MLSLFERTRTNIKCLTLQAAIMTQIYYYFILIRRNRQNKHDLFGKQQYIFSIKPIEDEDNNDVSIHM